MNAYTKSMAFGGSVLVADHGEVLYNKGYGFKNISEKQLFLKGSNIFVEIINYLCNDEN
jgi:hypothetical protein